MGKNIDTKLPVRFYEGPWLEDGGKSENEAGETVYVYLSKILFEDADVCLCMVIDELEKPDTWSDYVLFNKENGEVLNQGLITDLSSAWRQSGYYAENYQLPLPQGEGLATLNL